MATVIGEFVAKIGADMGGFTKGVDKADTKMGTFAKNFAKHRRAIGIGITAMGAAITGSLMLAMKSAASFEAGMREVNTMMGLGQKEFEAMSKDVLKLSKDLGVNAVDATAALYQAISAGVPKENVLTFMEVATKAAIGGVTDTETAVDGLTTVLNAFKIPMTDAQRVADVMFQTVKGGKTTFEELSAKMFNVAPIASSMGISFEEVSAALATMTKQGFPTAQATTSIRMAMVALQKPTAEMSTAISAMGYQSGQAMVDALGFGKALDILRDSTQGNNEQLTKMFGSVEAAGAVFALTGQNASSFTTDLDAMKNATDGLGASTEAFNEVEKGSARQLEKAQEQIKAVAIQIGGSLLPVLTPLIQQVGDLVSKVADWMEVNPELTSTLIKVTGALGALMLVVGPLILALPAITAALPIIGAGFVAMTGPIGLVVVAVAALTAGVIWLATNWDRLMGKTEQVERGTKALASELVKVEKEVTRVNSAVEVFTDNVKVAANNMDELGTVNRKVADSFVANAQAAIKAADAYDKYMARQAAASAQVLSNQNSLYQSWDKQQRVIDQIYAAGGTPSQARLDALNATIYRAQPSYSNVDVAGSGGPQRIQGPEVNADFAGSGISATHMVNADVLHKGGIVPGAPGENVPIIAQAGEMVTPANEARGITIIQHIAGSVLTEREVGQIAERELVRRGRLDYTTGIKATGVS